MTTKADRSDKRAGVQDVRQKRVAALEAKAQQSDAAVGTEA